MSSEGAVIRTTAPSSFRISIMADEIERHWFTD
jgi:hypothetical protein